jgi:XTP/dITP diphosphohydrolase
MPRKLLLGSNNAKKRRELAELLEDKSILVLIPSELGNFESPVEDGESFEENAAIKALHFCRLTGLPTLADDSGLEVDALDGAPGIFSSRYGGEGAGDEENCRKLLDAMKDVGEPGRTARFVCAVALAVDGEVRAAARGACEGTVLREKRGTGGFGYDPLFYFAPEGLTFAELPAEVKNRVSHRANALRAILPEIEKLEIRGPRSPKGDR